VVAAHRKADAVRLSLVLMWWQRSGSRKTDHEVRVVRRLLRGEQVAMIGSNSWNDTDFATRAVDEARARCEELRDVIRAQEAEREAMRAEIEQVRADLRAVAADLEAAREQATEHRCHHETWRREALELRQRVEGLRAECDMLRSGAQSEEAKMSDLDGVLSEATKRVSAWPEWKQSDDVKRRRAAFDARMEAMGVKKSDETTVSVEATSAPAADAATSEPTARDAVAGMLLRCGWGSLAVRLAEGKIEPTAAFVRAKETLARLVAPKAEDAACVAALEALARGDLRGARDHQDLLAAIERLRAALPIANAPTAPASESASLTIVSAVELASLRRLRDTADRCWSLLGEQRERLYDGELDRAVRDLVALVGSEGKTPTASASGEPGEVDPGRGGTETAGARESVARESDAARAPRVGDAVLLRVNKGFHPCVVIHAWDDGAANLRDLFDLDEVESARQGDRVGEWRFRD
jgi:hypothetical protein